MAKKLGDLPLKSKVKFGSIYGNPIVWLVADKNHSGFPANSVTLVSEKIIKYMCFDAKEKRSSDEGCKQYGNIRYRDSNIRQWINSAAPGGQWYIPQHSTDAPPNSENISNGKDPYQDIAGFLSGFTTDERNALLETTRSISHSTLDGDIIDQCTDKIFLLTRSEVNLSGNVPTGSKLAIFSDEKSRIAKITYDCYINSDSKKYIAKPNEAWVWYLASSEKYIYHAVDTKYSCSYTDEVLQGGKLGIQNPSSNEGLRPACNLSNNKFVSDNPDSDGCYTIMYNLPPTNPSSITVPETVNGGQSLTVSWGAASDPDGNLSGYRLYRKYNDTDWVQVYNGGNLSYTDTITFGKTTVQYRIDTYDAHNVSSAGYTTSSVRTIINNRPPTIDGTDRDLGMFSASAPSTTYMVNDADGGNINVKIQLDDVQIKNFTVSLGASNTLTFTADEWRKLRNGKHTWRITATDNYQKTAVRTITFTKNVTVVEFTSAVMPADDMPTKAIMNIQGAFPAGCKLLIEICNNGNDASPTWQDVTLSVQTGKKIFFSNKTKTAASWGVKVHVKLERGTASGDCCITSMGGNFG